MKNKRKGFIKMNTILTEPTEHGDIPIDIYQKLASSRILFVTGMIDDKTATDIVATLLLKDSEDPHKKISMFINSEGGDIRNIFMIYDMMKMIESPIETVCIGSAMDEAAILLLAGSHGMRFATKNSIICVGQLINDRMNFSDMTDAKIAFDQSLNDNKKMMEILSKNTGSPVKEIQKTFERKVFMNATQAVKYGIIDKVIGPSK